MVHDGAEVFHGELHAIAGDVGVFRDVRGSAEGDVGVHVLHFREEVFGGDGVLVIGCTLEEFAGEAGLVDADEGDGSAGAGFADEGEADGIGDVVEVDEDFFAFFQGGGVADQLFGEIVDAGIVHAD